MLSVTVNFDSVAASGDGVGGAVLSNYLAGFGITLSHVTPLTHVQLYDSRAITDGRLVPPSPFNVIAQAGSSGFVSYELDFSSPQESFSLTRPFFHPGPTGYILPEWHASAYDSSGHLLASGGESLFGFFSDVAAKQVTLNGPGIDHVIITSDGHGIAAIAAVFDDFVLSNVPSDLAATSLTWDTAQGGVDFGYEVAGADLTQDTTAALYWSTGTTFDTRIVPPVYDTPIEHPVGQYGPFYVPFAVLGAPPAQATNLLLVVDPDHLIAESDESEASNVKALPLPQPDIAMNSVRFVAPTQQVKFEYATEGYPGPFTVALYRSADPTFEPGNDPLLGNAYQTIVPNQINASGTGVFDLSQTPYKVDSAYPYLLAVADPPVPFFPDGHVLESKETNVNNVAFWTPPHLEITVDPASDGTFDYLITADPTMPTIHAHVKVVGPSVDLTPTTEFQWTTNIIYSGAGTPGARPTSFSMTTDPSQPIIGGDYTPDFAGAIRGGNLSFTVTATIDGLPVSGTWKAGTIGGTNPTRAAVESYIDSFDDTEFYALGSTYSFHEVLKAIISVETGGKWIEFKNQQPYWSEDGHSGVGLMQVTQSIDQGDPNQIWNWKENVDSGSETLLQKLRGSQGWADRILEEVRNELRKSKLPDTLVDPWTPDMIVENAIRGYNGYSFTNYKDLYKLPLLEFMPQRDAKGKKLLLTNGRVRWVRTPASLRYNKKGKKIGEPDYVRLVLAQMGRSI